MQVRVRGNTFGATTPTDGRNKATAILYRSSVTCGYSRSVGPGVKTNVCRSTRVGPTTYSTCKTNLGLLKRFTHSVGRGTTDDYGAFSIECSKTSTVLRLAWSTQPRTIGPPQRCKRPLTATTVLAGAQAHSPRTTNAVADTSPAQILGGVRSPAPARAVAAGAAVGRPAAAVRPPIETLGGSFAARAASVLRAGCANRVLAT